MARRGSRLATAVRMQIVNVGRGGLEISSDPDVVLITQSVCPSLAIAAYEPAVRVGGVLQFQLPDSSADPGRARRQPGLFADTAIPLLIEEVCRRGAQKSRLQTRLSGGTPANAAPADVTAAKRNYLAARKTLWKQGVVISGEAFGQAASTTAGLHIRTGAPWLGADEPSQGDDAVPADIPLRI
jgi:chemotaxis protein CheD